MSLPAGPGEVFTGGGNYEAAADDQDVVRCEVCREAVSAMLDGEAASVGVTAVRRHLASCAPCRAAADRIGEIDRMVRRYAAEPVPDLVDAVLAAVDEGEPGPRDLRCLPVRGPSHVVGCAPCGCSADCGCGCQDGDVCRCGVRVA